jgi:hypothetical protein
VETEAVKGELKWLTDQLGPAREYEVLIAEHGRPLLRGEPDSSELRSLHRELRARLERSLDKVRNAVEKSGREMSAAAPCWE